MKAESWDQIQEWLNTLQKVYQHRNRGISFTADWVNETDDCNEYNVRLNVYTIGFTSCYSILLTDEQVLNMIEQAADDMHEKASELNEMIIAYRKKLCDEAKGKKPITPVFKRTVGLGDFTLRDIDLSPLAQDPNRLEEIKP